MQAQPQGVIGEPRGPGPARDLAREHCADAAIGVCDRLLEHDRGASRECRRGERDQAAVERRLELVILLPPPSRRGHRIARLRLEQRPEIETGEPGAGIVAALQEVAATDHVGQPGDAERRHQLARVLGDEEEVAHDVLRRAGEAPAQLGILGGDPDRAGVEVADAHHHAPRRHQRGGREAELLGAEEGGDEHVTAGAQAPVDLDGDPVAKPVSHQHLVRLGQAELPRQPGVLERRERGRAGAAVVPGDDDVLGLRLRHTRRDGADPGLGHELDRDRGGRVHAFEVVDELGEILDRVDVVVRRRRDQADARSGVAQAGDGLADLVAGQLAALAGLCALGDLDLELVGIDQVGGGHTESPRCDLLDRRPAQIAVLVGDRAGRILAALARVRAPTEPVHRDRQRLVGLGRDRSEAHGAGDEPARDLGRGLDGIELERLSCGYRLEQPAQGREPSRVPVDLTGVVAEHRVALVAHRPLQAHDRRGRPHVMLAVPPVAVVAAELEALRRLRCEGARVPRGRRGVQLAERRCRRFATRCRGSSARPARARARPPRRSVRPGSSGSSRCPSSSTPSGGRRRRRSDSARGRIRAATRAPGRGTPPRRRSPEGGRSASSRAARPTPRPGRTSSGRPHGRGGSGRPTRPAAAAAARGRNRRRDRTGRRSTHRPTPPARPPGTARRWLAPFPRRRPRPGTGSSSVTDSNPSRLMRMSRSCSERLRSGRGTTTRRQWTGCSSSRFPIAPIEVRRLITSASRCGSMGGLVTCANCWRKKLGRSRGRSDRTAGAASSPIEPTGSAPSRESGRITSSNSSSV